jgi:alpha-L-rhamnosidase
MTEWRRAAKKFTLDVAIPPNTTATVFVPAQSADEVRESGGAADKSRDVKFLRLENGRAVFKIGSGKYQFATSSR